MIPSNKLITEYNRALNTGGNWRSSRRFGPDSSTATTAKNDSIKPPPFVNTLLEKVKSCPKAQQL